MHSETVSQEIETDDQVAGALSAESSTSAVRRLAGKLWLWWSLIAAGLLLLIFGPPSILVADLARRPELVYPWALFGARNWLRLSGVHVRVRGLEHLDPKQSYVFVANHRSFLDTATLFFHLRRRIGILAKKELLKVPILGYGMGHVNIMAIDRSNRTRAIQTMKEATDRLRRGVSMGVFAEGTRSGPGGLLPFKKGAFYMAIEAGVPVVPVAIKNTDKLMGKGTGVARPGSIEMVVLPPIATAGLSTDEDVKRLAEQTRASVAAELGISDEGDESP
ncbi:MAG: lysophospholipid acyltransferase family protein [Pyrinomonadaceae bacterium]